MNQHQPKQPPNQPPKKKPSLDQFSNYAKYSGLAFQLLATIGLAAWGGFKLDQLTGTRFPFITVLLVLLALIGSILMLIRQLPK